MKKQKTIFDLYRFLEKHNLEFRSCKDYVSITFYKEYIRVKKDTLLTRFDHPVIKENYTIEELIKVLPKAIKLNEQLLKLKQND